MEATSQELFRTHDLVVRHVGGFSREACVVTFDSFSDRPVLDRPGFSEHFLRSRGIDAIHVLARVNEWYQHAEILPAMQAIRAAAAPYGRVLTYGSSMGAYAAIRLAGLAGAQAALAMSPQFSILPGRVPFEHRWGAQAARQRDVWETSLPLPDLAEPYVFYDPLNLDAVHAEHLGAGMRTIPVRMRGAGHQVAGFLQDVGLLQRVVLDACRGPLDVAALEREAWRLRRRSPQARLALADRARSRPHRIAFLRSAVALAPGSAPVLSQLGLELGEAGQFAEAHEHHRAAVALDPGQPTLLIRQALTLAAASDSAAALATVAPLSELLGAPAFAALHARLTATVAPALPGRTAPVNPGIYPAPDAPAIHTASGQAGVVVFGPYRELRPGRYAVTFSVRPASRSAWWLLDRRVACELDVAIHGGRTVLARRRVSAAALRAAGTVTLAFEMPSWTVCEFRVHATGAIALVVDPQRPVRRLAGAARGLREQHQPPEDDRPWPRQDAP